MPDFIFDAKIKGLINQDTNALVAREAMVIVVNEQDWSKNPLTVEERVDESLVNNDRT